MTEVLRQRCPSFLGPNDALLFKASEYLQRAKDTPSERDALLRDSLRIFLKSVKSLPQDKLPNICNDFLLLNFFQGIVELSFASAQEADPHGNALQYYKDGQPGYVSHSFLPS